MSEAHMTEVDLLGWRKVMYRPDKITELLILWIKPSIVESRYKRDQYNMKLHKTWQKSNMGYTSLYTKEDFPYLTLIGK